MNTTRSGLSRRALLASGGALSLTALLAACTSNSPSGSKTSAASNQKLTLWMDSAFTASMTKTVSGFSSKYGVNLAVQPKDFGTILANYLQAAPAGSGPDLLDVNIDFIGPITNAKLAQQLNFGSKLDSLDKRAITGYTVDGKQYGLPLAVEATNVWRNTKLVSDPVETWDDLAKVGADLKAKGVKYPILIDNNAYMWQGAMTAFGGYVFKENSDGSYDPQDVGVDNAGSVAAFQWLADAVKGGYTNYVGATDNSGLDVGGAGDAWKANQVGIHISGPWMLDTYKKLGNFAIDAIPAGPAGPAKSWLSARGLIANAESKNAALAATFITDYLAAAGPMTTWAKATSKLSAWVPVQDSAADSTTKAFGDASKNAHAIPQNAELAGYWTPATDALLLIQQGKSTPKKAADNLGAAFRKSIKQSGK